jgi:hypothetical protein
MEDAAREDLIFLVKRIVADAEEQALKEELTKLLQLLSAPEPITLGTMEELINICNEIKRDFPFFREVTPIHEKLTELGLVEKENSLNSALDYGLS